MSRMITLYEDAMGFTRMVEMAKWMCAFPMVLREHLTGVPHKTVRYQGCTCPSTVRFIYTYCPA